MSVDQKSIDLKEWQKEIFLWKIYEGVINVKTQPSSLEKRQMVEELEGEIAVTNLNLNIKAIWHIRAWVYRQGLD